MWFVKLGLNVLGASSGGVSVHLHYFSPLSKGLFARGLSQAGASALSPWGLKRNALENAKKLAAIVGCPDFPTQELKRCLKQRPAEGLIKEIARFYGFGFMQFAPFGPVVERGSRNPFLDEDPYWKLTKGDVLDAPWITSMSNDEGLLPSAFYWSELDQINGMWSEISPYFLHYNDILPESAKSFVAKEVLEYYLGPGEKINVKNFGKFTRMLTDRLYGFPTEIAAKMQAKATKSPVYYYLFNYQEGENKAVHIFSGGKISEGVAHGQDCTYFYGVLFENPFSEKDKLLKDACQDMLYSYASTGKPSFDGTDHWKPTEFEELTYMNIMGPGNMKLEKTKNLTAVDIWKRIKLSENERAAIKEEL